MLQNSIPTTHNKPQTSYPFIQRIVKKLIKKSVLVVTGSVLLALTLATPAYAQIDIGTYEIYQNGRKVGEIYVPTKRDGQSLYVEHWVLFADYVYPSNTNKQSTQIVLNPVQYASQEEFFRQVKFTDGSRYIEVIANESTRLPTR